MVWDLDVQTKKELLRNVEIKTIIVVSLNAEPSTWWKIRYYTKRYIIDVFQYLFICIPLCVSGFILSLLFIPLGIWMILKKWSPYVSFVNFMFGDLTNPRL